MTKDDLILALKTWASWQSGGAASLGYPKRSAFVNAGAVTDYTRRSRGPLTARGTASRSHAAREPEEIPDLAALVDRYLARMQGGELALLRKALVLKYTHSGPDMVRAKVAGVGLTRFKGLVDQAHWYLIGRMG